MLPIVDELISQGKEISKLETWHSRQNAQKLEQIDKGLCGGVPFFYNDDTKLFICGSTSKERLEALFNGEQIN